MKRNLPTGPRVHRRLRFQPTRALALLLACPPLASDSLVAQVPVLVSTDWLAEHADDPDVLLVSVAMVHEGSPSEYIPGSHFLDYHKIATEGETGLVIELPPAENLVAAFRELGLDNRHHVVLYGSPGHMPARAYMTLDYLGHGSRTSVLDGGLRTWQAEGRPVTDEAESAEAGSFTPHLQDDVLVTADWILERLDDPSVTLIDARPEGEYTGERVSRDMRGGHIPGAYNLFWRDLQVSEDEPVLRRLAEVKERFEEAGATEEGVVVNYCAIGMRASYTYLITKHLGLDARFYDGSWNEWGGLDHTPAVKGLGSR